MTFLDSLVDDYLFQHKKINDVLKNILIVNFQCTIISDELKNDVDNQVFKYLYCWMRPEYEVEFLRKWDIILKDPHYYLYKHPEEICKI